MRAEREAFWRAWAAGTLLLRTCVACGTRRLYAAPFCEVCGSREQRAAPASGRGEIYSYTVVPKRETPPRIVVLVTLAEGARVLGTLEERDAPLDPGLPPLAGGARPLGSLEGGGEPAIGERVIIAPDGSAAGPIRFRRAEAG